MARRLLVSLAIAALCAGIVSALPAAPAEKGVLIAYEGFDYKDGAGLNGLGGGTGWKGAWFGADAPNGVKAAGPGMTFPGLDVAGLKLVEDGKDTRVFRYIDTERPEVAALVEEGARGKTFGKDGTTIWISFLIQCTSFPRIAHGGIHLMDGVELGADYKKTQRIQMGRQNVSKTWYLGRVDRGGPAKGDWSSAVVADGTMRLLVYRFDFKPGAEEGWMWVDPVPGKAPDPAKADIHAEKISDFRFNAVNVGSGGGAIYDFDELRIGTTFAAVAPAAKPARVDLVVPAAKALFDFRDPGEAKSWSMLKPPESELDEPEAKVEIPPAGGLKITFAGGRLPTITTAKLPAADWMAGKVFRADVTVREPAVVGFRVLQQKARRINGWAKQFTRWQACFELKPGKTTVQALLHPNDLSPLRADLGKVVALDIFACAPAKGQVVTVDNIRLDAVIPPELAPKVEPKTDFGIYPEPPAPRLPAAGETFTDPTFGTTILRVSDETDGDSQNAYSYWPSFNKDNTLFHIQTQKRGPTLYHFDPQAFKITGKEPLFARDPAFPSGIGWEDSIWSATDPKALFGIGGTCIVSYNVETKKYAVIHDFSKEIPGQRPVQMSRSLDDNVFGFHIKKLGKDEVTGFMAWQRNPEKVLLHVERADLDEVQVDKTGRYLVVKTEEQGKGLLNVLVYDLQTGKHEGLTDDGPDYSPGHSDNGRGFIAGADNWRNSLTRRSCAEPHRHFMLMDTFSGHLSMLADDEKWALVSSYFDKYPPKNAPWPTFAQEIYLVAADGSMRVRRLAHVQTNYKGYWDCPRADISRDGRFVVFTSNWQSGLRGVFILRVPDEFVPKTQ